MLSLHSHYLGGERKGKVPVLVGRTPSRSLHGHLGLQGEAQKKNPKNSRRKALDYLQGIADTGARALNQ